MGVPAHVGLVRLFLYPPILFPDACPGSVKFEPVQALCCPTPLSQLVLGRGTQVLTCQPISDAIREQEDMPPVALMGIRLILLLVGTGVHIINQ